MGLLNFLPEDPNKKEAMRAGLLHFGAAMLGGRGNFGQHLGQGLNAGAQGYQGTIQQAQKDQLEAAQLKLLESKDAREQQKQSMIASVFAPQPGGATTSGQAQGGVAPPGATAAPRPGQFPLSLNQVAQFKLMGIGDLSPEYKMANEGFKREQGATYDMPDGSRRSFAKLDNGQMQGDDGSVMSAPGYDDTMAATEGRKAGAIAQAKSKYELLPLGYVGEDGRPIGGTTSGYIGKVAPVRDLPRVGGTPPARAPMKTAGPAGFPVVTPAEQKQRDGTRLEILEAERVKNGSSPELEREIARAGGRPVLQSAAQARAQIGAVDATLNAGKGLNDNWITSTLNPIQADGKAAKSTLTQLETVKNVNFKTGWGAETKAGAANILASLGVKDAAKYAGNSQVFQQVAMERNMTMLAAQAGPQTEGDSERAQKTFMMLKNTPDANQFIADLTGANAREAARKADYYSRALPLAKAGGDLTEIDRRWSGVARSIWSDPALAKYKAK